MANPNPTPRNKRSVSARTRFEVFKRDGFRCLYCGATPFQSPLHVDHVVPLAEGGTNKPSNLVTACRDCNLGKSAVPLDRKRFSSTVATQADKDHAQQILEYLAIQRQVDAAKASVVEAVANRWESLVGPLSQEMFGMLGSDVARWPIDKLEEAIQITGRKLGSVGVPFEYWRSKKQGMYFHGILRKWRTEKDSRD